MDAFTVQQYVAQYLNAGGVVRLDRVYEAQPKPYGANLADYGSGATRCIGFVVVTDDSDGRNAGPAANPWTGQKRSGMRDYTFNVTLEIVHITAETDWIEAERQLKQDVIEGICQLILNDPMLGTKNLPYPAFPSAGEGRAGFKRTYTQPVENDDGEREQWGTIRFQLCFYEVG